MLRVLVRELKPYSAAGLADLMGTGRARALDAVKELMLAGVVRRRQGGSDDGETPAADLDAAGPDDLYQFRWVGLAMVGGVVFVAYPKYFRDREPDEEELKQIFQVLRAQQGRTRLAAYSDDGARTSDRLALMLELLERYGEHGEYVNFVDDRETCGPGAIDWGRTIAMRTPIISGAYPIYAEYDTRKTKRDDSDLITRLHRCVLTECSDELCGCGLAGLLGIDEAHLTEEHLKDLGDTDTLGWRLSRERSAQFATWKLEVLDLLERYVLQRESPVEDDEVQCLGTTSFYHVWETACKAAFGDLLDRRLDRLGMELAEDWGGRAQETLLGIIPHPTWNLSPSGGGSRAETDTLIPDTVTIEPLPDNGRALCIYDAKYYVPSVRDGHITGQPGVESVAKQFLYQSAYRDFVLAHGFDEVRNAFLVPTCEDELRLLGGVGFAGVIPEEEPPFSNEVEMWMVPANKVFEAYLDGMPLKFSFGKRLT